MAYAHKNSKGQTYFLHRKKVKRASGKETILFYFARDVRPADALDAVPQGYKVVEMKTGMPVLKKV
jgi:hypothetical protein